METGYSKYLAILNYCRVSLTTIFRKSWKLLYLADLSWLFALLPKSDGNRIFMETFGNQLGVTICFVWIYLVSIAETFGN